VTVLTDGDLTGLIGVYAYVAFIVALTWALGDRLKNPRKALHILTGGIVFFWWSFDTREVMAFMGAAPFVAVLLLASPLSPFERLRKSPLGTRTGEGHAYGLVMYAISWTVIAYLMFDHMLAASIAIAAMSFGDGTGEFIGRKYGRINYMRNRTVEGTAGVLFAVAVSVIVLVLFYGEVVGSGDSLPDNLILFALAMGCFVACLEAVTPGRFDNIVVPLVTGGYLFLMGV
jgi:dolichol kinase